MPGPFARWLLTSGLWLLAAVVAGTAVSLATATSPHPRRLGSWITTRLDRRAARLLDIAMFTTAFIVMLALVPGYRWAGDGLLGDEPKYLRIADSLYFDLDTDVGGGTSVRPTAGTFVRNAIWLARATVDAAAGVFRDADPPAGHEWAAGHLTVAGPHGGQYHLQSAGLPAILVPGLALQRAIRPDVTAPWLPLVTLAALWAFGFAQGVRLAEDVSGSRAAALAAGAIVAFSAPVFLSGYHFYPEAAALALVPWLARGAVRGTGGVPAAITRGIAIGFLPWLHVKFSLLAVVLLALNARRAKRRGLVAALVVPSAALVGLLALHHHRITGLFGVDALYRRYGPEIYAGPASFLSADTARGALMAFFGAVDGLFVMAPATIAGALAIVWVFRKGASVAWALVAIVAAVVVASAVHGGGAPGPPGRLMAPIACVFGAAIAVGLARGSLPFRWTVIVLALAGLGITATMHADWRRSVSPYRRMFATPEADFSRLLPGLPGPAPHERLRPDISRGLALLAITGFWAWWMGRAKDDAHGTVASRGRSLAGTHLAFWATIAAGTALLSALGP